MTHGSLGIHAQKKDPVRTHREGGHLQAKKEASGETSAVNI